MTKRQKKSLTRIIIAAVLMIILKFLPVEGWLKFVLYMVPYLVVGYDILRKAFKGILNKQVFDENFLMCIATFGALGVKEYSEAVAVMLFYQIGELFQSYAVNRSRQSISAMMDICPEYANIEEDGKLKQVDPDDVEIGTEIVIKAGERVPLDGVVVSGTSFVDTSALTGESVPREVTEGSEIISGCVNGSGLLKVRTTKEFDDSTVAKILELVENASSKKAHVENFITKFAKYYTPVVTIGAVILAILPPLILGGGWAEWIQRACIFLVISCPCALVISVPLGFFGGIGAASKQGVLVKGSNYLEALSEMKTIVFDKTGTLTKGEFVVSEVIPNGWEKEGLLEVAALAEGYSDHPISAALKKAYEEAELGELSMDRVEQAEEIAGHGIKAKIDGRVVYAGNAKLMEEKGVEYEPCTVPGTVVFLAAEKEFLGTIVISDTVKPEAKRAIAQLKQSGVKKTVMLTGDRKDVGEAVAESLGIDELPELILGHGAGMLLNGVAILEDDQRGDSADTESGRSGGILVHVHLEDLQLAGIFLGALVDDGTHGPAGSAPGSPEVDHNGKIGFQDRSLESGIANLFSHIVLLFQGGPRTVGIFSLFVNRSAPCLCQGKPNQSGTCR